MNDQTAVSVTILSRLLLAEQGPALAPGEGQGGIFLCFRVVQGDRKDRKGQNDGNLGLLGLRGRMCGNYRLLVTL